MIKPIAKPGPKPKKPRKGLKRTALKTPGLRFNPNPPTFVAPNGSASPPAGADRIADAFLIPEHMKISFVTHGVHRLKLPKTNPERKRERHMRDFDGGIQHDHFVRAQGCILLSPWRVTLAENECSGPIQAAHVRPRSTGGRWFDLVGLCERHHRMQERLGNEYLKIATGVDLEERAQELAERNLKEKGAI